MQKELSNTLMIKSEWSELYLSIYWPGSKLKTTHKHYQVAWVSGVMYNLRSLKFSLLLYRRLIANRLSVLLVQPHPIRFQYSVCQSKQQFLGSYCFDKNEFCKQRGKVCIFLLLFNRLGNTISLRQKRACFYRVCLQLS